MRAAQQVLVLLLASLVLAAQAARVPTGNAGGLHSGGGGAAAADPKRPWMELISWKPRAYLYHNFLTEEECDHIIKVRGCKRRVSCAQASNRHRRSATCRGDGAPPP